MAYFSGFLPLISSKKMSTPRKTRKRYLKSYVKCYTSKVSPYGLNKYKIYIRKHSWTFPANHF
ncbi:hypothetical protein C5O19_20170 [Siphonobacter curvatus]|uniref:Uncharacterized protein n=1 Tax=Siphonobacter curvatus TaxID=2094562 RepID=A0A2S7IGQ7_9BACT|nr:hypothetical protein C5O19_20170 [Siphonobacter curvatus]